MRLRKDVKSVYNVDKLLISLGIFPHLRGYKILKDAILYNIRHRESSYTKDLYNYLSSKYNIAVATIESNMRNAIKTAFHSGHLIKINTILKFDVMDDNYCLTTSQFISLIAQHCVYSVFLPQEVVNL